jgi:hypothetical protein
MPKMAGQTNLPGGRILARIQGTSCLTLFALMAENALSA